MLNSLYSREIKKLSERWEKPKRPNAGARSGPGFNLDQVARELAQEWNEMAMGWTDVAGGWQAG